MDEKVATGDIVYLRSGKSKHHPRDRYLVTGRDKINDGFVEIRKFTDTQLRETAYKVKASELMKTRTPGANHSGPHGPDHSDPAADASEEDDDVMEPTEEDSPPQADHVIPKPPAPPREIVPTQARPPTVATPTQCVPENAQAAPTEDDGNLDETLPYTLPPAREDAQPSPSRARRPRRAKKGNTDPDFVYY